MLTMNRKRRKFGKDFKARVALDAVRGVKTLPELASEYQVHPNQISAWRQQLIAGAAELFERGHAAGAISDAEELTAPLYQEIGRLKMENDFLRKKL
jgi:transposase-like protein